LSEPCGTANQTEAGSALAGKQGVTILLDAFAGRQQTGKFLTAIGQNLGKTVSGVIMGNPVAVVLEFLIGP